MLRCVAKPTETEISHSNVSHREVSHREMLLPRNGYP